MKAKTRTIDPMVQYMDKTPFSALAYDDWAYHRNISPGEIPRHRRWTVTHVPSGRVARHFTTKEQAKQMAQRLANKMGDNRWNGEGQAPSEFLTAVWNIVNG